MVNGIFDTHSHYTDRAFDNDRVQLLDEMLKGSVQKIMLATSNIEDSKKAVRLAKLYENIWCSVGIHPLDVRTVTDGEDYISEIRELAGSSAKVKAIGEIGLDYHYEGYSKEKQIKLFEKQIILAKELDLPVIVHLREATADGMALLKKYRPKGVIHCFSGSADTAKEAVSLGMYLGFTGVLTFKNAKKAVKAVEVIPPDRLLLETDSPYMSPEPWRGKRCDSRMIESTASKMAEIKGIEVQKMIDIARENGERLFRI